VCLRRETNTTAGERKYEEKKKKGFHSGAVGGWVLGGSSIVFSIRC
jgi:hypothetical protein